MEEEEPPTKNNSLNNFSSERGVDMAILENKCKKCGEFMRIDLRDKKPVFRCPDCDDDNGEKEDMNGDI